MFCGECGTKNKEGAKFCVKCGYALNSDEEDNVEEEVVDEVVEETESVEEVEYVPVVNSPDTKFCVHCGATIAKDAVICPKCGRQLVDNNYNQPQVQPQPVYYGYNYNNIPPEYKPIGMWGYFGYEILFFLPCIGQIILIVFALGGTSNINVKNFARSYFCFIIILAIILILLIFSGGMYSVGSTSSWY